VRRANPLRSVDGHVSRGPVRGLAPDTSRADGSTVAERGDLREHLLAAAERLLAESRPQALTTRAIARAAGVSDGVLYNYFADRDELVLEALVRRAFTTLLGARRSEIAERLPVLVDVLLRGLAPRP
jgi:AcrR family transcriptional regulator